MNRRRLGRSKTCVYLTVAFTFLYVIFFAKYAHFQLEFLEHEEDNVPVGESIKVTSPKYCPKSPPTTTGVIDIDIFREAPSFNETEQLNAEVQLGGWWKPRGCEAIQKVAIIIPYRDRLSHLQHLLFYLHPLLQRQQRYYRIYVVEQAYNDTFNKGRIMNIGYQEASKDYDWDCYIFHDVDMIPQNDNNLYECGTQPRHLSPALDEMRYTLMYSTLVGGVLALSRDQLIKTNGYSNLYWGWGSEDDDMSLRIQSAGYKISRPPSRIGRYKMVHHEKREIGRDRISLFADWKRWPNDGINSLHSLNYKILEHSDQSLFTKILVDIGPRPNHVLPSSEPRTVVQMIFNVVFFLTNV